MSTLIWTLILVGATGLFLYALRLPNPPKDKDHKHGC